MNQRTNNSVLLKRLKGWLALMMAVTMLFGSSMTVLAAQYTYNNASNVGEITTSTKYHGGDTIGYHVSGSVKVLVYVNGVEMESKYNSPYYVVTLSGDESVVYTVSDIVIDENSAGLYLSADIPVERYVTFDCGNNKISGISVGDTFSAGDSIKYLKDQIWSGGFSTVTLIIDGEQVDDSAWSEVDRETLITTYTFDKDVKVTGVNCVIDEEDDRYANATITFTTLGNGTSENGGEEDCDHSGEDCTHKGNDAGSDEEEEPKETEEQIFTKELLASVANVKPGDAKSIDATVWHSFSANVLKELLGKEGVSYTFYYNYGGECFYITIPAGAVLEEGCEWYGPLKLSAMFGRTIIEKSELQAAINQ